MIRFFSKLEDLPIISLRSSVKLAKIEDLFFDFDKGKILGVYVKKSTPLFFVSSKLYLIRAENILEWSNAVYIQSEDNIDEIDDLLSMKERLDSDFSIFGLKVFTKKGKYMGKVDDILMETVTMSLRKILIKKKTFFSSSEQLTPAKEIISITKDRITIKNPVKKVKVSCRSYKRSPASK
jgi:uncharacterized protein YrrD